MSLRSFFMCGLGLVLGGGIAMVGMPILFPRHEVAAEGAFVALRGETPIHDLLVSLSDSLEQGTVDPAAVVDGTLSILGCLKRDRARHDEQGQLVIPIISENIEYGRLLVPPRRPNGSRDCVIEVAIECDARFRPHSDETELTFSYSESADGGILGFAAVSETHIHRRDSNLEMVRANAPLEVGGVYILTAKAAQWFPFLLEVAVPPDGVTQWTTRTGPEEPRELVALSDTGVELVAEALRSL